MAPQMHSFFRTFSFWVIALLTFAKLYDAVPFSGASSQCQGVYIIATTGHRVIPGDPYGLMNNFTLEVVASIPGSTRAYNPYPNAAETIPLSIKNGSDILTSMVESYVAQCPNGHIVLIGYSEGGIVTMNTICGNSEVGFLPSSPLPTKYVKNLLAIITLGNESRFPGQKWNRGTCVKSPGLFPRLDSAACDPYGAAILDYCDVEDPDCCLGGTNQTVHGQYDIEYDKVNLAIVKRRYKRATT